MTFISQECEELFIDYTDPNNPFGQKKDKRIGNWISLLSKIPSLEDAKSDLLSGVIIKGKCNGSDEKVIENLLSELLPWRKGPFKVNNIFIDSEWRSNLKWDRFLELDLDLKDKTILDVGSGNGYYAFRMLGLEAEAILCLEPNLSMAPFKADASSFSPFSKAGRVDAFIPSGNESSCFIVIST